MSLPLQPDLHPWPPGLRRIAIVLALAAGIVLLGFVAPSRGRPPELILGGPGRELAYARAAERLIASARRRCWLAMYVVRPDDATVGALLDALAAARGRGVDVRVLLDLGLPRDGIADDKHVAPASWLAAHGIPVLLDEPDRTTHAKVLLVDDGVLVGSHNWTRSALATNREAAVRLDDGAAAAEVAAWFAEVPGWAGAAR